MSDRLVIELEGEAELLGRIDRLVRRLADPTDLLEQIGARIEANIEDRFDTKTDPSGKPWAPLAKSTLAKYAKEDEGRKQGTLLERTRQMRGSLTHNVVGQVVEIGMSRETKDGKWQVPTLHEFGTSRKGKPHMPRRGLLTADPEAGTLGERDRQDIESIVLNWLSLN